MMVAQSDLVSNYAKGFEPYWYSSYSSPSSDYTYTRRSYNDHGGGGGGCSCCPVHKDNSDDTTQLISMLAFGTALFALAQSLMDDDDDMGRRRRKRRSAVVEAKMWSFGHSGIVLVRATQ